MAGIFCVRIAALAALLALCGAHRRAVGGDIFGTRRRFLQGQSEFGRVRQLQREIAEKQALKIEQQLSRSQPEDPEVAGGAAAHSVGADSSGCSTPEVEKRNALARAEVEYADNLQRRLAAFKGTMPQQVTRRWFESLMLVPLYPCPLEARLGNWGEGGKWVCMDHYPGRNGDKQVSVSVGSRGESSYEKELYDRLRVVTHTFDFSLVPAVAASMGNLPYLRFYSVGLSGSGELPAYRQKFLGSRFVTVFELMEMIGEQYADILKIDCEACEGDVVRDLKERTTRSAPLFGQILMELHFVINKKVAQHYEMMRHLEELGYRLFHVEINADFKKDYELAFIHESLVQRR